MFKSSYLSLNRKFEIFKIFIFLFFASTLNPLPPLRHGENFGKAEQSEILKF
jgi:hypothetical protein